MRAGKTRRAKVHRALPTKLVLLLLLVFCSSAACWDFLLLVQQWGPGFCASQAMACKVDEDISWYTLHGLWPNNHNNTNPADCGAPLFDAVLVQPIQTRLTTYWPNFIVGSTHQTFWEHEYNKHGTCARDLPALDSQFKYFSAALSLKSSYDVTQVLHERGIVASGTPYSGADLVTAFKAAYGVDPVLRCAHSTPLGIDVLLEIGLCINKDLTIMSCDSRVLSGGRQCPSSFYILPHSSQGNQASPQDQTGMATQDTSSDRSNELSGVAITSIVMGTIVGLFLVALFLAIIFVFLMRR